MITVVQLANELLDQAYELEDAASRDDLGDMGMALDHISELVEKLLSMVEQ